MRRAAGTALAAAALALVAVAPIASAHTAKYDTTVTAKLKKGGKDANTFSGVVDSAKAKCVIDREVKVYMQIDNADDALIGSDRTDDAGAWEFLPAGEPAPGTYYALAAKTVLKKNKKHRHVCKRAASDTVSVK